jgi:hypothetical protein
MTALLWMTTRWPMSVLSHSYAGESLNLPNGYVFINRDVRMNTDAFGNLYVWTNHD